MKKHLLSMHGEFWKSKKTIDLRQPLYEKSKIEKTAAYELFAIGGTYETSSVENSDPDEFLLQRLSNSTFTQENIDEDEFVLNSLSNINDRDFDEILLI